MSVPGFSAEKSLAKAITQYKAVTISFGSAGAIEPAFCHNGWCCTCTDYGCVCQRTGGHVMM